MKASLSLNTFWHEITWNHNVNAIWLLIMVPSSGMKIVTQSFTTTTNFTTLSFFLIDKKDIQGHKTSCTALSE